MGESPELDRRPLHFGVFEFDPASGELRKHGIPVRLQEQLLKLLLRLIENPGKICTREELIRTIWPEGTFVDYERGLNVAVTRLRQVLGDSADAPRYIETVGRKGYRFVAPVGGLDARVDIQRVQDPMPSPVPVELPGRSGFRRWWLYTGIATAIVTVVCAAGWWHAAQPQPRRFMRLSVDLGIGVTDGGFGAGTLLALSQDGTRLAVSIHGPDGKIRLATRRFDQALLTVLPTSEGKLKKIQADGGSPVTLCEADTHAAGHASMFYPTGSWGDDGNIIATLNTAVGLSLVPSAGGPPVLLKMAKTPGEVYRWPQVLPGNEAVLFTASRADFESGNIEVLSLKTAERKVIQRGGILGRYLPTGHLLYVRRNALVAAPFDLQKLRTSGTSREVLEDMGSRMEGWNFDFSQTGSFVYVSQSQEPQLSIFWLDQTGRVSPLQTAPGTYAGPRFSPDGRRLAFSMSGRSSQDIWLQDIWVQDLVRGTAARLTSLAGTNDSPVWMPDGSSLIFRSVGQDNAGFYAVHADGSGTPKRLADLNSGIFPGSVSPDGKRFAVWDPSAGGTIWTHPIEIGPQGLRLGMSEPIIRSTFSPPMLTRTAPAFSPDGKWLAYCSLESGGIEVYVRPYPGPGGKWRISNGGGTFPIWSPNRRELFFLARPSEKMMVTSYNTVGDTFIPGEPRVWSERPLLDLGELSCCDIAPDGKRFAVVLNADGTSEYKPASSLTFLLNFFDELRRRVPVGGN
jgi:Tol biopolymer transport system component/DNA-binding winged helix-turn-helix (wHTH) protein